MVLAVGKRIEPKGSTAVPSDWSDVRSSAGHSVHVGKEGIACTSCHSVSDAGFQSPGEGVCAGCHKAENAASHKGSVSKETPCLTCHAFGKKESVTCISCHATAQGSAFAITHHAGESCKSCHRMHGDPKIDAGKLASAPNTCRSCHGDTETGAPKIGDVRHGGKSVLDQSEWAGVTRTDAGTHAGLSETGRLHGMSKKGTHGEGTCNDCHRPHASKDDAKKLCAECHQGHQNSTTPSGHACTSCHVPHQANKEAVVTCVSCHAKMENVPKETGHTDCQGCHRPHEVKEAAKRCETCHANHPALLATRVGEHNRCESCHTPHAPKANARMACAGCHSNVHPTHGKGPTSNCIDCHAAHPKSASSMVNACSTCHTAAKGDRSFHVGKLACTECHKTHAFAKTDAPSCASCHAKEAKLAASLRGHAVCSNCHSSAHTPTPVKSCNSCHAKEASGNRGHTECATCHTTHDGKPARDLSCTSCHETKKLEGLHRVMKGAGPVHGNCKNCHEAHGPSRADRATCTSCHKSQQTHQPEAKVCNGCHVFKD